MSVLTKKMLRSILRARGQAIAVASVVMCGTACYITLASAYRNLLLTRDTYYAQNRMADFEIQVERATATSLFKIEGLEGVRQVRGRIVEDVTVDIDGVEETRTGRMISMPSRDENVLDDIVLLEGRYFEASGQDEVILSQRFAQMNHLDVGDSLDMTVDGKRYTLRIVGLAQSPEYVYMLRNIQEMVPANERFGILWVTEEFAETAKNMRAACNNILGTVDNPDEVGRILDQAEDVLDGYGVYAKVKLADQLSNNFLSSEIKGLSVQSKVVPGIFLGVAALVIMILLNRMVRNERTQIGLMKAYGYSNWAVGFHYIQFALLLSVAGCLVAFVVGQILAHQIIQMYVEFYQFPLLRAAVYPDVMVRAVGIAIAFAVLGAVSAARRAAAIHPAESMRPEAPRTARRIFLERYDFAWRRMSFTWKMIARNVSRSRFRAGLNAFGVMVSAGLLIVGFFALDSIEYLLDYQFNKTQREDVKANLFLERGKDAFHDFARIEHVRRAEPVLQYPFEIKNAWMEEDIVVLGLRENGELQHVVDREGRPNTFSAKGLVLAEPLAERLGVQIGDRVSLRPLMDRVGEEREVAVSGIAQQYLGMNAYMNIDELSRLLEHGFAMNAVLLRVDEGLEPAVNEELKKIPAVASIEVKRESYENFRKILSRSMKIMTFMTVFFSSVIALSVIYNVTTVSLAERQRELASLRVLGFSREEVGRILYNENFVTGTIGLILGIPFGMSICWFISALFDTELYRFPLHVEPRTFTVSIGLTIVFIVIANLAVRGKIRRLDLVEVLKSRE